MTETDATGALAPRTQDGCEPDSVLVAALGCLLEEGERLRRRLGLGVLVVSG